MNLFLLLSAIVILACVLCNRLSNKLGVPTLLAFILLGMFFGFYPAGKASKMQPVDALRSQ